MKRPLVPAMLSVALALAAASNAAIAQYSVTASGTPMPPGTCTADEVVEPITDGQVHFVVPYTSDNVILRVSVNGGPDVVTLLTQPGGTSVAGGPTFAVFPSTPTAPPYTVVESYYPAVDGAPTGRGVVLTATCDAQGVGTIDYVNDAPVVPSTTSLAVPTLSPQSLIILALLVPCALMGAARCRPRSGTRQ